MSCAFFHFPVVVFPGSYSMLSTKKYMELSIQLYLNSFILVKLEINSIIIGALHQHKQIPFCDNNR